MAVLLTGGTGQTSMRIAQQLQEAKVPFVLASRGAEGGTPSGMSGTKFDWLDASTFGNPFRHAFAGGEGISAVYLVAPPVADPVPMMVAFVDLAVHKHGVKRFVLLTGSTAEKGGYHVGKVWEHLADLGVEHGVLRPTWFMENFSGRQHRLPIKEEGKIYTACGDGKIPFISVKDIAAVAFRALTDTKPPETSYIIGPELLTHDQVAAKFSSALGRDIVHVKLSEDQALQRYIGLGLPEHHARLLTSLEVGTAKGSQEMMNDDVEKVTGRPAQRFDDWVQENKTVWQ